MIKLDRIVLFSTIVSGKQTKKSSNLFWYHKNIVAFIQTFDIDKKIYLLKDRKVNLLCTQLQIKFCHRNPHKKLEFHIKSNKCIRNTSNSLIDRFICLKSFVYC